MIRDIEEYLGGLRRELAGADAATVQDALSDAEEHLTTALDGAVEQNPHISVTDALAGIIASYGSPAEVAAAYKDTETHTRPALAVPPRYYERSLASRFFSVVYDPRAWGAMLYGIIAMITGIVYFTWVTTGLYLSIGLLVLIIGLPIAYLFLLSFRGIALVEGRIVEGLLGVRMPRRPIFARRDLKWWDQLKALVSSGRTWLVVLYMLLQLPLGIIYFTLIVCGLAVALDCIALPITQGIFDQPFISAGERAIYYVGNSVMPLVVFLGFILLVAVMHMARGLGKLHGKLAKSMLVGR